MVYYSLCCIQAVETHAIIVGLPEGCERESCTYYVGIGPNAVDPSIVEIYLEGQVDGWIAIGFSMNMLMVGLNLAGDVQVTNTLCCCTGQY